MTMSKFAEHILAVGKKNNIAVTNLNLHETMYYVLRHSSDFLTFEEQMEIYNEPFYAWRYGPFCKSQYFRFSIFGSSPIRSEFNEEPKYEKLNDLIVRLLKIDPLNKVQASYSHRFWRDNKEKILNGDIDVKYKLKDVLKN